MFREYPHKIWPKIWYNTSNWGSWNDHWDLLVYSFTKVWPKQKNYHVVEKLLVSPSSSNWLPIEGIRILQAPNCALIAYAHACCHGYLTNHYPKDWMVHSKEWQKKYGPDLIKLPLLAMVSLCNISWCALIRRPEKSCRMLSGYERFQKVPISGNGNKMNPFINHSPCIASSST